MSESNNSRRQFLQTAAVAVGAMALSQVASAEGRKARGAGGAAGADPALAWPMVKAGEGMAKSVNYVEKHSDVKDEKIKTARQGVAWDKQYCNNCMLHTAVAAKKDGKEVAKCSLFANQLVAGQGWCTSWAKQA